MSVQQDYLNCKGAKTRSIHLIISVFFVLLCALRAIVVQ